MTEFRNIRLPEFKLGIKVADRDLTPYYQQKEPNKPIMVPRPPQQNIFFTPINDNREQILQNMRKDIDYQLEFTRTQLPPRS